MIILNGTYAVLKSAKLANGEPLELTSDGAYFYIKTVDMDLGRFKTRDKAEMVFRVFVGLNMADVPKVARLLKALLACPLFVRKVCEAMRKARTKNDALSALALQVKKIYIGLI